MNKAVITALNHQPEVAGEAATSSGTSRGRSGTAGWPSTTGSRGRQHRAGLARYKVSHVIIGHTKQYTEVNARFDGKVLLTDVFSPNRCVDPHAFLIKQGDTLTTVYRGHTWRLGRGAGALSGPDRGPG